MKRSVFLAHDLLHWEDAASTQCSLKYEEKSSCVVGPASHPLPPGPVSVRRGDL